MSDENFFESVGKRRNYFLQYENKETRPPTFTSHSHFPASVTHALCNERFNFHRLFNVNSNTYYRYIFFFQIELHTSSTYVCYHVFFYVFEVEEEIERWGGRE